MLNDKTIIVTGGGDGIGEEIAKTIVRHGGRVVIGEMRAEAGEAVAKDIGDRALAVPCDVRDDAAQRSLVEAAIARFGRIDGLVNNAGLYLVKPFLETSVEDWDRLIDTDLKALFFLTQKVVKAVLEWAPVDASIVNIASVHALGGAAGAGPYDAAKAGVIGLTRSLAVEFGEQGVRINAVSPGAVNTQIYRNDVEKNGPAQAKRWLSNIPLGRIIEPGEIAELVAFLLSDNAKAITGANFVIDAGMTAQLVGHA